MSIKHPRFCYSNIYGRTIRRPVNTKRSILVSDPFCTKDVPKQTRAGILPPSFCMSSSSALALALQRGFDYLPLDCFCERAALYEARLVMDAGGLSIRLRLTLFHFFSGRSTPNS